MANPLLLLALLGGAAAFMLKKPEPKKTTTSVLPSGSVITTPTGQTSATVTIPPSVLAPVDNTVEPDHVPTVTVTPPAVIPDATVIKTPGIAQQATTPVAQTPQQVATQVATQVVPSIVNQVAAAVNTAASNAGVPIVPPTVLHTEEVKLDQDPNGTIALAKSMMNAESSSGWKTALANDIKVWQARMKLTADGKFGPKSAMKMAEEVGVLPLVRYYASTGGTKAQQVAAYTTQLGKLASSVFATNPAHSVSLRSSQAYEQGQGYSTTPAAVPASSRIAQAAALAENLKVA